MTEKMRNCPNTAKRMLNGKSLLKHSRLGITSSVIAIIDISVWLTWFVIAAVGRGAEVIGGVGEDTIEEAIWLCITHIPFVMLLFAMIFLCFFGAPFLSLAGVALGVAGVAQKKRLKSSAILGIALNVLFIPIKALLFILGFIIGGSLPWDATP